MKNIGSELGGLLKKICLWGGAMAVVCWAFTLLWGFDITQLAGFALGWGYIFHLFSPIFIKKSTINLYIFLIAENICLMYFIIPHSPTFLKSKPQT